MGQAIDSTERARLIVLRTGDDKTCFGCGGKLPVGESGRGTSRYSSKPTVHLCGDCCTAEALLGKDCFDVAALVKEAKRWGPL